MDEVAQWAVHEITLEAERSYAEPFAIGPLATFASPPGAVPIRLPGFWDGGNVWRIRVALPASGHWRWITENPANPNDRGLHGQRGELECLPASGQHAVDRHGFLRVSATGRVLEHADGTPFFWLGDTIWRMNYASPSEAEAYAARRRAQGFSVACYYAAEPIPNPDLLKSAGYHPAEPLPGVDYLSPAIYQARVDPIVRALTGQGLVVYLQGLWGTELDNWGLARCLVYWRYLVARYTAFPVVWSVSGEWDDSPSHVRSDRRDAIRALGRTIQGLDPYHHPITVHPREGTSSGHTFHGDDWLSFNVQQSRATHDRTVIDLPWEDYRRSPAKPNIDLEHVYEGEERGTEALVRWAAYASFLQGALAGHTYGAHGIWDWNTRARFAASPLTLCDLPGAQAMQHFGGLFRSLAAWPRLAPHRDWVTEASGSQGTSEQDPFCAAAEGLLYVVYLPVGKGAVTVTHLGGRAHRARWYNPRRGSWTLIDAELPPAEAWTSPVPPDGGDWVLVLDHHPDSTILDPHETAQEIG